MSNSIKGDCLIEMNNIPDKSVDLILTDLPYETTDCAWDILIPFEPMWKQYHRVIKSNGAIVLFGQEPFSSALRLSNLSEYKYDWYWQKERLTNIFQVKSRPGKVIETISVFYKEPPTYNVTKTLYEGTRRSNKIGKGKLGKLVDNNNSIPTEYVDDGTRYPIQLINFKRDILTSNLHPTQKPVKLLEFLINIYTNEGETVLDSCSGSGSTGIACINTNREYILIEKDKDIFEIGSKRIADRLKEQQEDLTYILK